MATWTAHLRVAENKMNDFIIECSEYIKNDLREKGFYLEN
ncbi:hypothetical protein UT300018_32850 [Clostridium faecium]